MSAEFSARLSTLRKDRDVSQKQAAIDLEVSQALLSHYEKGIRECSLDFVKRCAHYYGVSADYLLGLSDHPHGGGELSFFDELETDSSFSEKTTLRALVSLGQNAEAAGETQGGFFADYFALAIARYIAAVKGDRENALPALETAERLLEQQRIKDRRDQRDPGGEVSVMTVLDCSGELKSRPLADLTRSGV